jgi:hypothetical protein
VRFKRPAELRSGGFARRTSSLDGRNNPRADRVYIDVDSLRVIVGRVVDVQLPQLRRCTPLLALCLAVSPGSALGQPSEPNATVADAAPADVARILRATPVSTEQESTGASFLQALPSASTVDI